MNESQILEKDLRDDKVGILDIKAKLNNKITCNLEMQVVKYSNIEKRILYYWSKLYTSGIREGEDYNVLDKTIIILIADFELDITKDIPKTRTKWEIREEEYKCKVLTNMLEINIIELPKLLKIVKNKRIDKKDKLSLWITFFLSLEKIGVSDMEKNKDIEKAKKELEKINQDEREKELARLRMKHIMDQKAIRQYGYEQGFEQGLKREKERILKIAKDLIQMNIPIEKVMEITNLTKEEIKQIK